MMRTLKTCFEIIHFKIILAKRGFVIFFKNSYIKQQKDVKHLELRLEKGSF